MKAKQLKNWLNKLSKDQLEKDVIVIAEDIAVSRPVDKIVKQPFDLLWDGEDDPSTLHSRSYFIKEGYDIEDLDSFTVEVAKGDIVIKI